jgi:hypothetical protein
MSARCDWTLDELTEAIGRAGSWPAAVRIHISTCDECAAYARLCERLASRLVNLPRIAAPVELEARVNTELSPAGREQRITRRLAGSGRVPAPPALDGRVVAAIHEGHKQERAAQHLSALPRAAAPAGLDLAVAAGLEAAAAEAGLLRAPGELDGRVAADLRAGFRLRLERLARAISSAPGGARSAARRPRARRSAVLPLAALLGAFLLGWSVGLVPVLERGQRPVRDDLTTLRLAFEVESAGVDQLSPMGHALLSGISGGLFEAMTPRDRSAARTPVARTGSPRRTPESGAHEPTTDRRGSQPAEQASLSSALLDRIPQAALETRYTGQRLVRLVDPHSGVELVLREVVSSDGLGRFSVDPNGVIEAPPGSEAHSTFFPTLQKGREGFIFRYRDFSIRDLQRFYLRYVTRVVSEGNLVAGRECILLDVRRAQAAERYYLTAVDLQTGLVLGYEERLVAGDALLAKVGFETIEIDPGLELPVLSGGPSVWQEFDLQGGVPGQPDVPLHPPGFIPAGYSLERTATRTGPLGNLWVEYVYSDGVEQLFFLHSGDAPNVSTAGVHFGDRVCVASMGSWTVVEGEVLGTPVLAVARLDPQDLLLLVQSAFD